MKGVRGTRFGNIEIDPTIGVVGRGRYAIKRTYATPFDWQPKGKYYTALNRPWMAASKPVYIDDHLGPKWPTISEKYLAQVLGRLGVPRSHVVDTQGRFSIVNTPGPFVSILNVASVRAFEKFLGGNFKVDPLRFRADIGVEGLEPFEELSWVDADPGTRLISIGGTLLRIDDAIQRCPTIDANPDTGATDADLVPALEECLRQHGYAGSPRGQKAAMGVYAVPLTQGYVRPNDSVRMTS